MLYVYILSTYGEYGAQDVVATLDRNKLENMVSNWTFGSTPSWHNEDKWKARCREWVESGLSGLRKNLDRPDAELAGGSAHECHDGWGGLQLHVVALI